MLIADSVPISRDLLHYCAGSAWFITWQTHLNSMRLNTSSITAIGSSTDSVTAQYCQLPQRTLL
jgi:hypothetical protein